MKPFSEVAYFLLVRSRFDLERIIAIQVRHIILVAADEEGAEHY